MKKLPIIAASALVTALAVAKPLYAQIDHSGLSKQLEIMTNILQTAFKQVDKSPYRIRQIDASYLEKQGVVYTFSAGSSSWTYSFGNDFHFDFSGFPGAPKPPEAPVVEIPDIALGENVIVIDEDGVYEYAEEMEEMHRDAMEVARDALRSAQRSLRRLSEKERDLEHEVRDIEREKRDLEFQLRHADEETKKELEKELKEIDKEFSAMKERKEDVSKSVVKIRREQKEKLIQTLEQQKETHQKFVDSYQTVITEMLCNYGASLRALPEKENISFVIDDMKQPGTAESKDFIHVFSKEQVMKCLTGNIDAKKLLNTAEIYYF